MTGGIRRAWPKRVSLRNTGGPAQFRGQGWSRMYMIYMHVFPIYIIWVICVWYVCLCAIVCICSCNCMQLHVTVCNCMYACVCVCVCSAYFLVYFPQAYLSETGDPKPSEIPYFLPEIDSSGVSNSDKYRGNDTHLEAGNSHIFHFGISRRIMSFHMEYGKLTVCDWKWP